jgi:ribosomal-protein-alanine N-acetyltransferase
MKEQIETLRRSKSEADRRKCISLLSTYLESHPEDAKAWYDKASCHDFLGEEREAEPCYRQCFEIGWRQLPKEEQRSFFVGFGSTLRNNLNFSESISVLKSAAQAFPDYPALKIFLALSYYSHREDRLCAKALFSSCLESVEKGFDGYERAIKQYVDSLDTFPESRDRSDVEKVNQPRLETSRLILEPYRDDDLEDIFAYARNPEVTRLLTWPAHRNLDDSRNFLRWVYASTRNEIGNLFFVFAIRLKETGKVVGSIDFKNPQPWVGQIDYVLAREHWGKGLMPEAGQAVKDWAFKRFPDLIRFQAYCEHENKSSARVMEKLGMTFEGVRRKSFKVQNRIVDLAHYALIREPQ